MKYVILSQKGFAWKVALLSHTYAKNSDMCPVPKRVHASGTGGIFLHNPPDIYKYK